MWVKLFYRAPPALHVLAVMIFLGGLLSREASTMEDLPAFFALDRGHVYIEVSGGGLVPGVYQFSDGMAPMGVIKLTVDPFHKLTLNNDPLWIQPLHNGESITIVINDQKIATLERGWMNASHSIFLGIPLHPDHMSLLDWKILPGVGDALAERIEIDRQKNGDFL
jgi:hypothetical protein